MRPPLDGGTVLVTGASSGLGRELARRLARDAGALILVARRAERLNELAAELRSERPGLPVHPMTCDLTDRPAMDRMLEGVRSEAGAVDVLVNCAGMAQIGAAATAPFETTDEMIRLNVLGPTYLTRRLLPGMLAAGRGGILNVGSFFGLETLPGYAAYAGTKHYVTAWTETLRAECAGTGVVVSGCYPGPMKSSFWRVENGGSLAPPGLLFLPVDRCARAALAGFRRGRARIVPGLRMKLAVGLLALTPPAVKRALGRVLARRVERLSPEARQREGRAHASPAPPRYVLRDEEDWTFGGSWPWEPRWFRSTDGWMHYVDEGPRDAPAVLLLHGNPTWGYLYRNFIPPLLDAGYRVIVPDHLGFGRSEKPDIPELYRIPRHAERLEALLERLDLRNVTLVPQDWGGPIGIAWAGRHPERVRGLFILNTFAHRPNEPYDPPTAVHWMRRAGLGELLVKGLNVFVRGFLFRQGIVKQDRMTDTVRTAYLTPHRGWTDRTGILVFPREIPVTPDVPMAPFLGRVEKGMARLSDRPVFLAWAMQDPVFRPEFIEDFWLRTFPDARILRLAEAGHYLQEDAHEEIVPALLRFLSAASEPERHRVGSSPDAPRSA